MTTGRRSGGRDAPAAAIVDQIADEHGVRQAEPQAAAREYGQSVEAVQHADDGCGVGGVREEELRRDKAERTAAQRTLCSTLAPDVTASSATANSPHRHHGHYGHVARVRHLPRPLSAIGSDRVHIYFLRGSQLDDPADPVGRHRREPDPYPGLSPAKTESDLPHADIRVCHQAVLNP